MGREEDKTPEDDRFGTIGMDDDDNLEDGEHRGNPRKKFVDGWVEFCSKKIAKRVTDSLNGQTMGGDKRNYWRDDVWNIKYLPKFKWYHLAETITYANAIKTEKMKAGSNLAKRENEDYLKK